MFDAVPYSVLIPLAVVMALAPLHPKPHLVEKLQMLVAGDLRRPLDVFDLVLHSAPLVVLLLKWLSQR